ncbi:hypothetical protein Acr_00g0045200 [Actinidia rufa]|uniref:Uncharacterized protein n=1 Tax=Actinidia rufa TaxID=165716 RepID=A0A7J0DJ75_9ERIC|nr:hypothetical protein Acr_00g0045200 [Actinidia rufa]
MVGNSQAPNLKGLHCEMHGIAKQIQIMNENNAFLIQHLAKNHPPPPASPIPPEVERSRRSRRLGNCESQSHQTFLATLKGLAKTWFRKLSSRTIDSFGELSRLFVTNFMSCRVIQKNASHLFTVHQKEGKSLKDYVKRFNQGILVVEGANDKVMVMAMMEGLCPGLLVTKGGIEANPDQIQALLSMRTPRNIHEVHQLTGWVTTLNRFVFKSADKCLPFFEILRKNQAFQWTDEFEEALQQLKEYLGSPPLLTVPTIDQTLKQILQRPNTSGRILNWFIQLSEFYIEYKPRMVIKAQALTDFVAEFTHDVAREPEITPLRFRVATKLGVESLDDFSDSQLVVNQVQGDYLAKNLRMIAYLDEVKATSTKINDFQICLIPRKDNKKADALANLTSAFDFILDWSVPLEFLQNLSIEVAKPICQTTSIGSDMDGRDHCVPPRWNATIRQAPSVLDPIPSC